LEKPLEIVTDGIVWLEASSSELGSDLPAPFSALSFLALPVIPELRLADNRLVDVKALKLVSKI
jgi:adenine deaminase